MPSDPTYPRELTVAAAGVRLLAREHTAPGPGRPTVVLVHGYPDRQEVWDALVAELSGEQLHLVTYDVRGAGRSEAPPRREDYRTELLVDDLVAVLEAVLPAGSAVHLVGHDWGSVQLWDAVAAAEHDDRLRGRIASFTSISGPSLDHMARLPRKGRELAVLRQYAHSWYVAAFQLPYLPELAWRYGHPLARRLVPRAEGPDSAHWGPGLPDDAVHGLELYRANVLRRMRRPGRLRTDTPVLVIHPLRDAFLTEVTLAGLERECSDLAVVRLDAGHWAPVSHAPEVAALVLDHVRRHQPDAG